jgi:hypothetical protein
VPADRFGLHGANSIALAPCSDRCIHQRNRCRQRDMRCR